MSASFLHTHADKIGTSSCPGRNVLGKNTRALKALEVHQAPKSRPCLQLYPSNVGYLSKSSVAESIQTLLNMLVHF